MSALRRLTLLLPCCFLPCLAAGLQPRTTPLPTLQELTRQSGYIFAGTVVAVKRIEPARPNSAAVVQVTFRVEQPIRNVRAGQLLVISEWAGLWEAGPRYQVWERLLLFLYRPSKLGLTSPVRGTFGRFPLDSHGRLVLSEERRVALLHDPAFRRPGISGPLRLPAGNPAGRGVGAEGAQATSGPAISGRSFAGVIRRLAVQR